MAKTLSKEELLHVLKERLNKNGKILIGDVAFETCEKLNECRQKAGNTWDNEEFYFVADELKTEFPNLCFTQVSHCAGILTLSQ